MWNVSKWKGAKIGSSRVIGGTHPDNERGRRSKEARNAIFAQNKVTKEQHNVNLPSYTKGGRETHLVHCMQHNFKSGIKFGG